MRIFTRFITITSTALLMAAPLYASDISEDLEQPQPTQLAYFDYVPDEIKNEIFISAVKAGVNPDVLRGVCKNWRSIVPAFLSKKVNDSDFNYHEAELKVQRYMQAMWGVKTEEDKKTFETILNGKLVWQAPGPDANKIELPFSDFPNPFKCTFNLSDCGKAAKYLTITQNLETFFAVETENPKLHVLITTHFWIEKYISTTPSTFASPLVDILDELWDKGKAPIGIFWRWSGENDLQCIDYLASHPLQDIMSKNIYKCYIDSWTCRDAPTIDESGILARHPLPRGSPTRVYRTRTRVASLRAYDLTLIMSCV